MNRQEVRLSGADIELLLGAETAAGLYNNRVKEPFEEHAKTLGERDVYEEDSGLEIRVNRRTVTTHIAPKDVVQGLRQIVQLALANQESGRRMAGVRAFDGTVAVDAQYLDEQMENLTAPTGTREDTSVSYKVNNASKAAGAEIARDHAGRLATVGYRAPSFEGLISASEAALYVAAVAQIEKLGAAAKEIKDALKGAAEKNPEKTTWTPMQVGDFAVTVKTVPRFEANYREARDQLQEAIGEYAALGEGEVDNVTTFFNADLHEPRAYVAAEHILGMIADACVEELKFRQSVDVGYFHESPLVLALD